MSLCLWKDLPNGDILVSMGPHTALLSRSADGRAFIFHHDQLLALKEAGLLTAYKLDPQYKLVAEFTVGALPFVVEDWDGARDLYRAELRSRPGRFISAPGTPKGLPQ